MILMKSNFKIVPFAFHNIVMDVLLVQEAVVKGVWYNVLP
jgi:hypothetical protein